MNTHHGNIVGIVRSWKNRTETAGIHYSELAKAVGLVPMTVFRWIHYDKYETLPSLTSVDKVEKYLKEQGV